MARGGGGGLLDPLYDFWKLELPLLHPTKNDRCAFLQRPIFPSVQFRRKALRNIPAPQPNSYPSPVTTHLHLGLAPVFPDINHMNQISGLHHTHPKASVNTNVILTALLL